MPASNHNYVCFRCRTAIRHPKTAKQIPKCLSCGEECFCLGYKVEVPRHSDAKSWRELEEECQRRSEEARRQNALLKTQRQHFLEKEIQRMKEMPVNRDRSRQIRQLEERLLRLTGNAAG